MRRITFVFSASVLCVALLFPQSGHAARTHPTLLDSVRPLSQIVRRDFTTGVIAYRNICTVSAINTITHLWLTAAHCVVDTYTDEDGIVTTRPAAGLAIEGHLAFIVKLDEAIDLVILITPDFSLPALRLADKGPFWEDAVRVIGHPYGDPNVTIVPGTVSNPNARSTNEDLQRGFAPAYMYVTTLVAPGNSGSPIVNARGELVSVLQIGWGRVFSHGGGSPYAALKAFAGGYFER